MPEPIKLQFRPGINRETTDYGNTGGYYDGNLTRFKNGTPESIAGWQRFTTQAAQGTFRSLFPFSLLNGTQLYGAGTSYKYYYVYGSSLIDITPIRKTVNPMSNNPFTPANGTKTVTVTDVANGATAGDFVTYSGATGPFSSIPASDINQEHQIVTIVDADHYTITVATTASANTAGGGNAVVAVYQLSVGLDTSALGNGWGTGPWGGGVVTGWGQGSNSNVPTNQLRLWSQDNFGEDLLINPRNGGIYYQDTSAGLTNRAVNITTLGDGPSVAMQVLVSNNDRHVLAFGCNPVGDSVQDRTLIRWSETEDVTQWTPDTINTAGSLRIDLGSTFISAVETTTEILVFTDVSLHSFRYIGAPYIFGQTAVGTNIQLLGPNAAVSNGSETYWMANGRFQMYNGTVYDLPCMVRTYIYSILNTTQAAKVYAGINRQFGEVWWHIPVNGSDEVNYYVVYNYVDSTYAAPIWYYGSFNGMGRTAWLDAWYVSTPLACATDGYIYSHEVGATDGSVTPNAMLESSLESSVVELANGGDFAYVSRLIPDLNWDGSTVSDPSVIISFLKRDYPGDDFVTGPTPVVAATSISPPLYNGKKDIRFRARSVAYKIETSSVGTLWQQGVPRVYASPDGQR